MPGIGNPESSVVIWASGCPPAVFAKVSAFDVIPSDQQDCVATAISTGSVDIYSTGDSGIPPTTTSSIAEIRVYLIPPVAGTFIVT